MHCYLTKIAKDVEYIGGGGLYEIAFKILSVTVLSENDGQRQWTGTDLFLKAVQNILTFKHYYIKL